MLSAEESYPTAIIIADLLLLLCQVLGILLSFIYHTKLELYFSIRGYSTPQISEGEGTPPQKPSTSLAVQEVENLDMVQMRQVMVVSHNVKDISAVEMGEGGQEWPSREEGSGGKEGTEECDGIADTKVTEEEMKEEGKVIPEAEMRKEEGVVEERMIKEAAVKEYEEVDQAVPEEAEKTGEEEEREEGKATDKDDMREKQETREDDIVNQETGLVVEQAVMKGFSVREDSEVSQEYLLQEAVEESVRETEEGVVNQEYVFHEEVEE